MALFLSLWALVGWLGLGILAFLGWSAWSNQRKYGASELAGALFMVYGTGYTVFMLIMLNIYQAIS